jgi:putative ABC transport system permease protein
MRQWWSKLRAFLTGRGPADELEDEIQAHLELEAEANLARGMAPEAARAAARRHFGNPALTAERSRQAWSYSALETIGQELKYAWRGFLRAPGFSLVVILTLALGIGANTAIFSVIDAVLLRPLPYPESDRLVRLAEANQKSKGFSVTWVNYQHWRAENHSFDDMAAFEWRHFTLTGIDEPLLIRAGVVTHEFFGLLDAHANRGRLFDAADDRRGAPDTVVLSQGFWLEKLGGDPKVVGKLLNLDGKPYQVIGVLAPVYGFFPKTVDAYVPLGAIHGGELERSRHGSIRLLARLKPGVTLPAATADLDQIMQRLAQADPGPEDEHRSNAIPLAEVSRTNSRSTLLMLMGAVTLVLAIACANVAGLMLARGSVRAKEMAIRAAIGASRLRIIRQLVDEGLLLSMLGGACGLLLAYWCLRALIAFGPRNIPRLSETTLNPQVLAFATAITLFTGVLVGLAPVVASRKLDLVTALKESSQMTTRAGGGHRLRSVLVIGEVSITLLLVFTSGLLFSSLIAAENSYPGFAADHLLELELILPSTGYKTDQAIQIFYRNLAQDLRNLPGVASAADVYCPPSSGGCGDWFYSIPDRPAPARGEVPIALFNMADPGYFRTMQIPLREGRAFTEADRAGTPAVAIVNEAFAHQWWPRESAVGKRIKYGGPYMDGPALEIVGVAGNVSQLGLDMAPEPEFFLPFTQQTSAAMVVMLRTAGDPEALSAAVRRRVREADPNLPIQSLQVFEKTLERTLERRRFITRLLALFAILAIVLAGVGVYGLLAYWVNLRQKDIAVRVALGARRMAILRWVGSRALGLAALGTVVGVVAAEAASRWIQSLVFAVSARNPIALFIAAAVVFAITAVAAALPAWRATRVDPVHQLRDA